MGSSYDREFALMRKRVMALRLSANAKRSIVGQLWTLASNERQALYAKVIQRYGGSEK